MKILLLSFYDLGKQPKVISDIYNKLKSDNVIIKFFDFSIETTEVKLDEFDAIGIYASMHTATVLAKQYIQDKELPNKTFSFGLYGQILADSDKRIRYIKQIDNKELEKYLEYNYTNNFSYKESVPDRSIFPEISNYVRLIDGDKNLITGSVETTYGCRHMCTHCPVPIQFKGRFKTFSENKIVEDIANQIKLGAEHISFNDPDFFNGPKYSLRILETLNKKYPSITYDSTIKVEHIIKYKNYFKELKDLNMLFVTSAFETTNDFILKILDKNHSSYDLKESLDASKRFDIDIRPTWMPFTPWTKQIDLINIIKLIEQNHIRETVDPIQLTIKLLIPRLSLIANRPEIRNFILKYDKDSFTYSWSYSDDKVDLLQNLLFNYVVENSNLDKKEQYIGLVDIIEDFTDSEIIINNNYVYRNTPTLSETWFCCAEPNKIQLERIKSNKAFI